MVKMSIPIVILFLSAVNVFSMPGELNSNELIPIYAEEGIYMDDWWDQYASSTNPSLKSTFDSSNDEPSTPTELALPSSVSISRFSDLWIELTINQSIFGPNDRIIISAAIYYTGPGSLYYLDFYRLLDVYGTYYWGPFWTQSIDKTMLEVYSGITKNLEILDIQCPNVMPDAGPFYLWVAMTGVGTYELVGDPSYTWIEFSFRSW